MKPSFDYSQLLEGAEAVGFTAFAYYPTVERTSFSNVYEVNMFRISTTRRDFPLHFALSGFHHTISVHGFSLSDFSDLWPAHPKMTVHAVQRLPI